MSHPGGGHIGHLLLGFEIGQGNSLIPVGIKVGPLPRVGGREDWGIRGDFAQAGNGEILVKLRLRAHGPKKYFERNKNQPLRIF